MSAWGWPWFRIKGWGGCITTHMHTRDTSMGIADLQVSRWVATSVLMCDQLKKRRDTLAHFIKIAEVWRPRLCCFAVAIACAWDARKTLPFPRTCVRSMLLLHRNYVR